MDDLPLFPPSASTFSDEVDLLYFYLIAVSAFFSLLIGGLLIYFVVRYRRRSDDEVPEQIHGSTALEILWSTIPLVIALSMFVWGAKLYVQTLRVPPGAMRIDVTGKQWMWKLQHPTGHREINELHVPVGVPVELRMISEDVIHDFYVPAFRTKLDVLPGRYSTLWFEATATGEFHLFCAEYCGTQHSQMIGKVIVMEPEEYEQWLAGGTPSETPREAGEKLFGAMRCDTCHGPESAARGPDLAGRFGFPVPLEGGGQTIFDANYVRESLLDPGAKIVEGFQPLMPTYAGQLNEEQILSLIAYLESIAVEEEQP